MLGDHPVVYCDTLYVLIMATTAKFYELKTTLRWLSTWQDHKTGDTDRSIEFMDIGLAVDENNMQVLTRTGKVQENSAWAYVDLTEDDGMVRHFMALKLSPSDNPNGFRYFGFDWRIMTLDGLGGYLCQHSVKAEDNPEHSIKTYMQMFMRKEYKKEQKFHITLVHKDSGILVA